MTNTDRGQVAASAAEVYEEFFIPALFGQWPEHVLDGVGTGDRVLDVGCGTGVLARAALSRVGPTGSVAGIDPNDGMLAVASRIPGVSWEKGFAEDLPFADDSFDAVVSQFAMMFFDDRARAVDEMARVLAPGGRVAVATWSSLELTPGYAAMVALLRRLFGESAAEAMSAPFVLGNPDELGALLGGSFDGVRVEVLEGVARFASIEDWVHTDVRGWTLSDMAQSDYESLLAAALEELSQFTAPTGEVTFPAPALVGYASLR